MTVLSLIQDLSSGMLTSVFIFAATVVFSLPLGLLVAFVRMSKVGVIRGIGKVYISILRGTPLMLQLMFVFYGPYYLFGVSLSTNYRMPAVLIGFALNYAAYFAEIYRAGIESIDPGQYEAAQVLGYSRTQTFIHIIFPQVIKRILPPVTNEIITLVKDTSLAFALAVTEMFTITKQIASHEASMVPYIAAAIFYYVFNLIVAFVMERIEKKLDYYK